MSHQFGHTFIVCRMKSVLVFSICSQRHTKNWGKYFTVKLDITVFALIFIIIQFYTIGFFPLKQYFQQTKSMLNNITATAVKKKDINSQMSSLATEKSNDQITVTESAVLS